MLDLVVKERRASGWTRTFLDVTDRVGDQVSAEAADRFRKRLRTNRRRHRQAREAGGPEHDRVGYLTFLVSRVQARTPGLTGW